MLTNSGARLRIAMVAPPWFPIPPKGYGGIEAMVHALTEGLIARGHEVTLIGAGPYAGSARQLKTYEQAPLERLGEAFPEVVHALLATDHLDQLDMDVVHDHCLGGPLTAGWRKAPTVLTAHGPVSGEVRTYYQSLSARMGMVAISEKQRATATACRGWPRSTTRSRLTSTRWRPRRRTSACSSGASARRRRWTWRSRRPAGRAGAWWRPSATSRPRSATSRSGCGRWSAATPSGSARPTASRRRTCWRGRAAWSSRSSGTSRSGS